MDTSTKTRNRILKRISRIPEDKLKELDEYVTKLENESVGSNSILAYAGKWEDIDDEVFNNLTGNLISNRKKNRPRIDE